MKSALPRRVRTIALYRFRHVDPLTGRWITARYRSEAPAIRCRYPDYELLDPEIRHVPDDPFALQASHVARAREH